MSDQFHSATETEDKARRGRNASIDEHKCIDWLNSRKPNSVIYVCFGSLLFFSAAQLLEIATGLENSEQQFIWVVRKEKEEEELEEWLPKGFEKRMEESGLIIRGLAPQVLILDHEAVGGFVTHCGWNSLLEGVTAGVPIITWPLFAEQFYNQKLITDILKIGVAVGAQKWTSRTDEYEVSVERREIEKAVRQLIDSEEADEMRSRARALGNAAKKAVEEGGSSCASLDSLLEELRLNCPIIESKSTAGNLPASTPAKIVIENTDLYGKSRVINSDYGNLAHLGMYIKIGNFFSSVTSESCMNQAAITEETIRTNCRSSGPIKL